MSRSQQKIVFLSAVLPSRPVMQRLAVVFFITLCMALLVVGKGEKERMSALRAHIADIVVPVANVFSKPVDVANNMANSVSQTMFAIEENTMLRQQNARLKRMQIIASQLQAENSRLKEMLSFVQESGYHFITARMMADVSNPFVRATMVNAGEKHGVRKGQITLSERGLVGRVLEVGSFSSRVLLLNDLNSRVPVITTNSHERGILAGDGSLNPKLVHLPMNSNAKAGESVTTSGDGQYFPAGIPVGMVVEDEGALKVKLFVTPEHIEYVNIVDYYPPSGDTTTQPSE